MTKRLSRSIFLEDLSGFIDHLHRRSSLGHQLGRLKFAQEGPSLHIPAL